MRSFERQLLQEKKGGFISEGVTKTIAGSRRRCWGNCFCDILRFLGVIGHVFKAFYWKAGALYSFQFGIEGGNVVFCCFPRESLVITGTIW